MVVAVAALEALQKTNLLGTHTRCPEALSGEKVGVLDLGERRDEAVGAR
jgi:hypothetical protein